MAAKPSADDVYTVGYKKPPVHTRFQPGQSGNPKGRPKGALNLASALNKALKERVDVIEKGRRRTLTKLEVAVTGLVNRAVKGDPRAMAQMLALSPLVGIEPAVSAGSLEAHDAAVLASLVSKFGSPDKGDGA